MTSFDLEVHHHARSTEITALNCQAEDWVRRYADPGRASWLSDGSVRISGKDYPRSLVARAEGEGLSVVEVLCSYGA